MPVKPPNIRFRGLRSPDTPRGYLLGRISAGSGEVELLNLAQLQRFGLASHASVQAAVAPIGFGFNDGGLLLDNELLGTAVFSKDVLFTTGNEGTIVTCLIPATTAPAVFNIKAGTSLVTVGTITFGVGATVGAVVFAADYTLPAGTPISLYAPTPNNATLASVTGKVVGQPA